MSNESMTYESALKELQEVINDLRGELTTVDDLSSKVQRAKELIEFCKVKLRNVGSDLEGIF